VNNLKKDEIEELRGIIEGEAKEVKKIAKIIYDGRQYSVRIPLKMAKSMQLDHKKDEILFELISPKKIEDKPELRISVVRK